MTAELLFLYCPTCAGECLAEAPPCPDGHGDAVPRPRLRRVRHRAAAGRTLFDSSRPCAPGRPHDGDDGVRGRRRGHRSNPPTPAPRPPGDLPARGRRTSPAPRVRPEVRVEPLRPPQRLAPFSYAVSAEIIDAEGKDLATGRLVLLHDPDGHEAWDGVLRLVAYASAELDEEMGVDPMLPAVGWSWLTDALDERAPRTGPPAARSPRPPPPGSATSHGPAPRCRSSCAPRGRPTPPTSPRTCSPSSTCCAPPPGCRPRA